MAKRALISVSDKSGAVEFARGLSGLGFEIISTGGTARVLQAAGLPVQEVSAVTGFPEILGGRVKTLHPMVHGGILAKRDEQAQLDELEKHAITPIDVVAVNLYPFRDTVARPNVTMAEALENIDIGGPTMVRAAAKNHPHVIVVVNPGRYPEVLAALQSGADLTKLRLELASEAFAHTAAYDAMITNWLGGQAGAVFPAELCLSFKKVQDLRYGENPHQQAAFYREEAAPPATLARARQLQGKELSFNNINDADAALRLVREFRAPAAVAVKHTNPCGVAVAPDLLSAYRSAYKADPVSIFGGVVAVNRPLDEETAREMSKIFLEIVIAPGFTSGARQVLADKRNLRLLEIPDWDAVDGPWLDLKRVAGGLLVQDADTALPDREAWQVVSQVAPAPQAMADMEFAWTVVKHVKSNAIVVAKGNRTLGVGAGQMNRIDAARHALRQAGEAARGSVLASDERKAYT